MLSVGYIYDNKKNNSYFFLLILQKFSWLGIQILLPYFFEKLCNFSLQGP